MPQEYRMRPIVLPFFLSLPCTVSDQQVSAVALIRCACHFRNVGSQEKQKCMESRAQTECRRDTQQHPVAVPQCRLLELMNNLA